MPSWRPKPRAASNTIRRIHLRKCALCCLCACRCCFLRWAKPTPRRLLPSSGGFTCARVRAPTIATRSWRETMRPSPCALRSLCWVLRFSRRHWCLCECAKWLASLKKGVDCSTPFVHVREWRVYKRDARIRSAGSGSSGRRRFCGTQTCQR